VDHTCNEMSMVYDVRLEERSEDNSDVQLDSGEQRNMRNDSGDKGDCEAQNSTGDKDKDLDDGGDNEGNP